MRTENRKISILKLLEQRKDVIPAREIAELLDVSTKTVYRLINTINESSSSKDLIVSEFGRGFSLNSSQPIDKYIQSKKTSDLSSPLERRNLIKEHLLLSSPKGIKIYDIFDHFYISESAIAVDQKIIAEELEKYDLQLVRKNRSLSIVGSEGNIRRAIFDVIKDFDIIDLEELKMKDTGSLNPYDVLFISGQLRRIEQELHSMIPYPYNINIFSHLYILMIRSRKVNLKNLTHLEDKQLNLNESFHSKLFYDVAKETIQQIEVYLSQKLPEIEIIYLYQYLQSSRIQSSKNTPVHFTEEVIEVTKMYLDNVGKKLGVNTHETVKLTELASHIKPMVNRLLNHIPVRNGLIYEIVSTYGDIFRQVSEVSKQVSKKYGYPVIDDNENGFITLYFANMIERKPVPAKVIIVCTTGIGTSELLKTKVGKNFPELQIVGVVATRNLQKEIEENPDIDLIITTVHLTDLNSYPVVLVSAMFNQEDKSNIRNHLEGLNND